MNVRFWHKVEGRTQGPLRARSGRPDQNIKKLNTGLLTRLWYPPTLLVCSYTYRSPDRSGFQPDLAKRQSW